MMGVGEGVPCAMGKGGGEGMGTMHKFDDIMDDSREGKRLSGHLVHLSLSLVPPSLSLSI